MARPASDALAGAALDASQLLDVDVDQLAGALALVAPCGLEPQSSELAHPDPGKDSRDRGERHPEDLGDLRAREAQPPQRRDRLDSLLLGAVRDRIRRRGAVEQPELALGAVTPDPLASTTHADLGGLGCLRQRPSFLHHPSTQLPTSIQTESRVTDESQVRSTLCTSACKSLFW